MKKRFQFLPIAFFTLLFFFLNWYVLSGLQTVVQLQYLPEIFWGIIAVSVGALIYAITSIKSRGMDWFFKIATHAFLIFFVSEILFLLVIIIGDIYRLLAGTVHLINDQIFTPPARSIVWISFGIGLFLPQFCCLFMGY